MDSLTYVGTATTLLRLGSFTVLTDPNFLHRGQRAYLGKGLWSRRLTEPAMQISQLPVLDAVVLSHLHGDHFDRVARRELDRAAPVITTTEAADRLAGWGFTTQGLETWERHLLTKGQETLSVEAVPAVHARGVMGRLLPPVMGSVLEHRIAGEVRRRLYLTGDTLTGDHIDVIRERHPDLDATVVHLGGTRVLLHTVTMDADQGVDFLRRLRPNRAIGVHHDDYGVFRSPVSAWVQLAAEAGFGAATQVPGRGETVSLGTPADRT